MAKLKLRFGKHTTFMVGFTAELAARRHPDRMEAPPELRRAISRRV
jgi:hypothetical protein